MKYLQVVLSLCLLVAALASYGQTGDNLQKNCRAALALSNGQAANLYDAGICTGTVKGAMDMAASYKKAADANMICFPEGVTTGQNIKIVMEYLENHPQELQKRQGSLIYVALRDAFPCR
jgi:hypothetical protein